jgi:hypothetical protein
MNIEYGATAHNRSVYAPNIPNLLSFSICILKFGGDRQSMLKGRIMTKRARRGTIRYESINRPLLPSLSE